ncbi:PDZ domain-containing protein [Mycetocola sp. JXN-3]|uniref:YlbL family protein n=1 Tax=Mycetocola sp. JXN-3 TaxID=2116510 RepID=UPI00165D2E1F|nr:S16 family serine protease [Mycetocola sp. JXN-3]
MSLFEQTLAAQQPDPRARRRRTGWVFLLVAMGLLLILAFAPSTYLVQQPGPVENTLGTTTIKDKEVPIIEINGEQTHKTTGNLDLLTVQLLGDRERPATWLSVIGSWFDRERTVVPIDEIYPAGVTTDQRNEQNQQLMVSSQQDAIAAALKHQGYAVPSHLRVTMIQGGAPADGKLRVGDEVISVNGTPVEDLEGVQKLVKENGTKKALTMEVTRDGAPLKIDMTPTLATASDGSKRAVIGVGTGEVFDFPFEVKINLADIGGPSAGMMFALGIIDKLSGDDLTGGAHVAGTGTIDAAGNVGPIGGIRQKLYGAKNAGATYFLAPASNCNEVAGHVPDGLRVFSTEKLTDSLKVLDTIKNKGDLDALPTCK